eukprot:scaffold160429_cov16-Prasinocladus_malaysianus.AAC.1
MLRCDGAIKAAPNQVRLNKLTAAKSGIEYSLQIEYTLKLLDAYLSNHRPDDDELHDTTSSPAAAYINAVVQRHTAICI